MAKKLLILLLVFLGQSLRAQKESNVWYFGSQAGLDFNSGSPVPLDNSQMDTFEGTATVSDSSGELLFYTDGMRVWNKNHQVMSNGSNLMGNSSSSQACVIVPKPDSSTRYYIFTTDEFGGTKGLRYSEVDISMENGLGNVTSNKNISLAVPACEKITAVKKKDNSGFWIVAHDYGSNKFLSYSVTSLGVNGIPVVSVAGAPITSPGGTVGYLKSSTDGTRMASCNYQKNLELYDFNSLTGVLSNAKVINTNEANYGAEFSPSGKILYVTTGTGVYIQQIVQYDLNAPNVAASAVLLGTTNSQFGALQLASDGKIYVSLANSKYLGTIHQPENIGATCNFEKEGAFVGSGMCVFGLPQSIPAAFTLFIDSRNTCLGGTTQFTLAGNQDLVSAEWDFGDGNGSNELSPSHLYAAPGAYLVTVLAKNSSGATLTRTQRIVIAEIPIAHAITDKVLCASNTGYDLALNDAELKGSQTNPNFKVAYFVSEADAHSHTAILPNSFVLSPGTTTFYAKIYNNENASCYSIGSFTVTFLGEIAIGQPSDYHVCESPYDGISQFNLAQKDDEVLNGLNASDFVITYHADFGAAMGGTGALPVPYANSNPQETIYARLENRTDASCFRITSFIIAVGELPVPGPVGDMVVCGAGKKAWLFDLSEKNAEVLGSLSSQSFAVAYYFTEEDALEGNNAIEVPIAVNSSETVYAAVRNIASPGCISIVPFNLIMLPALPDVQPAPIKVCDDAGNDGVAFFDFQEQTAFLLANQPLYVFDVTYHVSEGDAAAGDNAIENYYNLSNPQTIYARVASGYDASCYEVRPFEIAVHRQPVITAPDDLHLCSENGSLYSTVDLFSLDGVVLNGQQESAFAVTYHRSLQDAQLGARALSATYNATVGHHDLYIRVENTGNASCFATASFEIIVYPELAVDMKTEYVLCENGTIELTAPAGFDSYGWSTGETSSSIVVAAPGTIALTVGQNHQSISCSSTLFLNVVHSSAAVIKELVVSDWMNGENSIRAVVEGLGDYEYSIDGITYQGSPEFYGLQTGEYTVYVKDINGCGIASQSTYFLNYPKFFTPNGDGHNEQWHIQSAALEPDLKIYIFDRNGILLKLLDAAGPGWDGTCNNTKVPSADYWFVAERKSGKTFKGHFSLMR